MYNLLPVVGKYLATVIINSFVHSFLDLSTLIQTLTESEYTINVKVFMLA